MKGVYGLKHVCISKSKWRLALPFIAIVLVVGVCFTYLFTVGGQTHAAGTHAKATRLWVTFKNMQYSFSQTGATPPTDKQCRQQYGIPCYSPQEMRKAYGVNGLLNEGYTGKGETIVIIDSYGSPTIKQDLKTFDAGYGLPDPPSFKIDTPLGTVPFDPSNSTMVSWAFETSLDVEWAHAYAPDAKIILMTSPVAETQGIHGMPQFLFLEQYVLDHHLGKIISQSWATTENTLFNNPGGRQVLISFDNFYQQAADNGESIFGSTGDSGVANPKVNGNIYPFPTVNFPASDPYVTAVGGTSLTASTSGKYQSEVGWSYSGGGVSQYFSEPDYQSDNLPNSDQKILNGYRGLPDISFNADPNTPVLVYTSFVSGQEGYYFIGGTSEGSPSWAGITADGDQFAEATTGHHLGNLNEDLYELGNSSSYSSDFHDITTGNNSQDGITGYNCTTGWDPVTGWGSPQATALFTALVQMEQQQSAKTK
jgi:subtilase family serine protease